jgi:SAM-dependent methyltransferase
MRHFVAPGVDLHTEDAISMKGLSPESVDLIFASNFLEHLDGEELDATLERCHEVLKPGGRLIFCEHGKAPDQAVRRWQDRLNPIWGCIGGGCNLNRDIPALIEAAGRTQVANAQGEGEGVFDDPFVREPPRDGVEPGALGHDERRIAVQWTGRLKAFNRLEDQESRQ